MTDEMPSFAAKRREFLDRQRAISDSAAKISTELNKAAVEYGKLVVTNLHFINAGGIVGFPAIIGLLGLSEITKSDRSAYILYPLGAFTLGLLMASACALFAYRNYMLLAGVAESEGEQEITSIINEYPKIYPAEYIQHTNKMFTDLANLIDQGKRAAQRNYYYAHAAGFLSLGCFLIGSALIALSTIPAKMLTSPAG